VLHPHKYSHMSDDAAIDRIRRHFRGIWDSRAAIGTLVHSVNQAWTWGEEVDIAAEVNRMAYADKGAVRLWQGYEPQVVERVGPYVDGLKAFWADFRPSTVATEEVIRTPDSYIGQRDWVATIAGRRMLIEIKTTAQQDPAKGLYWDSWRLQLAAQRYALEIVTYDDQGVEVGTHPNYSVDAACVLHLRGDGDYRCYEVQAGLEELGHFLRLVDLRSWLVGSGCTGGQILEPPVKPFTTANETLAGLGFAQRFAATVKSGDGKNSKENERLRQALLSYATGGRTSSAKAVLKSEIAAVREAWQAWSLGRIVYSDADDGSLVDIE